MIPGRNSSNLVVTIEDPHSRAAALLIARLSKELGERYGDDGAGAFSPDDVAVPGAAFVIARVEQEAVGGGALRPVEPSVAEIKRMFVEPHTRGRGVAQVILQNLESLAREFGYERVILETGTRQPEAIRLYESAGYQRIACYGPYVDNPLSVCFEKRLR
jgi:GNAT superfamily N-acetyltransferase